MPKVPFTMLGLLLMAGLSIGSLSACNQKEETPEPDANPAPAGKTLSGSDQDANSDEVQSALDERSNATEEGPEVRQEPDSPTLGMLAPSFTTTTAGGEAFRLADFRGNQPVALVFFPKDDTPGCTRQMCNLRDHAEELFEAGVAVFGISFEDQQAHADFTQKHDLTTPLLMDSDHAIGQLYGVEHTYQPGLVLPKRTTFVIDQRGVLIKIIDEPNVDEHHAEILAALEAGLEDSPEDAAPEDENQG